MGPRSSALTTSAGTWGATAAMAELALPDGDHSPTASHPQRLIVLNHFPYGYDQQHLRHIEFLAERGPAIGISTIVVTDDPEALATIHPDHPGIGHALPALDFEDWLDPWTSTTWTFTPDRIPADTEHLARVLERVHGR